VYIEIGSENHPKIRKFTHLRGMGVPLAAKHAKDVRMTKDNETVLRASK
jgi:hypothetical protein